jgi:hypothetical protein
MSSSILAFGRSWYDAFAWTAYGLAFWKSSFIMDCCTLLLSPVNRPIYRP